MQNCEQGKWNDRFRSVAFLEPVTHILIQCSAQTNFSDGAWELKWVTTQCDEIVIIKRLARLIDSLFLPEFCWSRTRHMLTRDKIRGEGDVYNTFTLHTIILCC